MSSKINDRLSCIKRGQEIAMMIAIRSDDFWYPQLNPFHSRGQLPQGSLKVWEVAGAERLDPGGVVAIEAGRCARTSRRFSNLRRAKP
jgi:hypothetical protein